MIALIDTIFNPVLAWLSSISMYIHSLSVPVARPLNLSLYLGPFAYLGPYWITFITTGIFLAFVYIICFLVVSYQGMFIRFKDSVKWW